MPSLALWRKTTPAAAFKALPAAASRGLLQMRIFPIFRDVLRIIQCCGDRAAAAWLPKTRPKNIIINISISQFGKTRRNSLWRSLNIQGLMSPFCCTVFSSKKYFSICWTSCTYVWELCYEVEDLIYVWLSTLCPLTDSNCRVQWAWKNLKEMPVQRSISVNRFTGYLDAGNEVNW